MVDTHYACSLFTGRVHEHCRPPVGPTSNPARLGTGGDYSAPQTPGWIFKERGEKTDGIKVKREANRRNEMEADQVWGKTDAHGRHL